MSLTIGSNIASLKAQRQLALACQGASGAYERLSSGQRINRASDDAAGLAVASRLNADSRLYTGASKNVNDGISVLSIIDGALAEQTGVLQRLAELAEQSANGTFSLEQREALNQEYRELVKEFSRIAESTSFNGQKLLQKERSGNLEKILFQAGINGSADSLLAVTGVDTGALSGSLDALQLSSTPNVMIPGGSTDVLNVRVLLGASKTAMLDKYFNAFLVSATDSGGTTRDFYFVTVSFGTGQAPFQAMKDKMAVAVFATDPTSGTILTTRVDGARVPILTVDLESGELAPGEQQLNVNITEIYGKDGGGEVALGLTANFTLDLSALRVIKNAPSSAIDFTGVETVKRARNALTAAQNRIADIASLRGWFGAAISRLDTAKATLFASRENVEAAKSRITDIDVAAQSAELVKSGILQQVAAAILAQANQTPALAAQLLGA